MNYLSVCSGIEAATVAWHPLGWSPVALSQFDPEHNYKRGPDFASAVLAHHYPNVPNLGDMTKFRDWPDAVFNVLVGGTPCQSFSVAGLRKGLADPRGNLMLTYLAIADRYRPDWLLWENVPGVLSSNGGRDFGAFLGALGQLGYGFAYRVLDAQFVRMDGFARAVPQRRRRVFVVGYLGDWRRAAAVLFERESLFWNSPPRRQPGEDVAGSIRASAARRGGVQDEADASCLIASTGEISHCLNAGGMGRQDYETETVIAVAQPVADTLTAHWERSKGAKAGNQVGLINPIISFDTTQITSKTCRSQPRPGEACHTLSAASHAPSIAFGIRSDASRSGEARTPSLDANGAVRLRNAGLNIYEWLAPTLDTGAPHAAATSWAVRRLTPRECERLQGFPDDYTLIPRGRSIAADGPRYKALGNSMAVNVMRWLGARIEMVSRLEISA